MAFKYVKGIGPLLADTTYQKIFLDLQHAGYDIRYEGDTEKISGENVITQFRQKFKIFSFWTDDKETQYYFSNSMPLLTISLMGYEENSKTIYVLSANIPGTSFDWEGEDTSLYLLRDVFIEDAISSLANDLSEFIVKEFNKNSGYKDYERKIRQYTDKIYERLVDQVKEDLDKEKDISLEELDEKIDIIMDALGLKEDEDSDNNSVQDENVDIVTDDTIMDITNNEDNPSIIETDITEESDEE